ncbi:MAG: cytochrome c oxidase subunit II, partial [Gammaproteobacteria bacterium]|nr:cytochrome c oxidase subunit II [Gammaproteobacteria bacterium]
MSVIIRYAGFLCLLLASSVSMAGYQLDMEPGVTSFSQDAYEIHQFVMWICVGIGVVVFGAMIFSILFHRKSKGAIAAKFDDNTYIEIAWTIIPIIILILMAVPATKVLLAMEDTSNSDMSIKVTGYQWKWHYDYLAEDINFFSNMSTPQDQINDKATKGENYLLEVDNVLVIPTNKKVRFLFTSNDTIHAWWVPAFGVKKDAIPGFINEAWAKVSEPGIYRGQCAELCGVNHGFMPIVVEVKSEADYAIWVKEQKAAKVAAAASAGKTWTMADLMKQGEKVYNTNCAACHQPNGAGIPNVFPAIKGGAITMGDVSKHLEIVIK